jgi:hypothetical protein
MNKKIFSAGLFVLAALVLASNWNVLPTQATPNTNALVLNGSSQSLSIADGSQTGLDFSTAFTIQAWVKPASQPSNNSNLTIVSKYQPDNSYLFAYRQESSVFKLYLDVSADGPGIDHDGFKVNQTLSTGVWYHLAVTWDGATKTAKFYVNGSQVGGDQTGSLVSTIVDSGSEFRIGHSNGLYWNGSIDDVRAFNRVLSQGEILATFGRELEGDETGLVGYWTLNGIPFDDETTNNNNLTNNASASVSTVRPF